MGRQTVNGRYLLSLQIFRPFTAIASHVPGWGDHWVAPVGVQSGEEDREILLPRDDDIAGAAGGDRLQILVVEDDVRFVALVERILADGAPEFEVVHASRVTAALARLVRQPIRLILTDLRLPDGDGAATVRHLTRAAPNVPLIVLSGTSDLEVALECIRDGAEEFVLKQALDGESLVRLIRTTMERRLRLARDWEGCYDDAYVGVQGPAALEAVGRQLLKVADRTGLNIGVLALRVEGQKTPLTDEQSRIAELSAILHQTLRRCDVIARVEPNELAVVLVGGQAGSEVASARLADAFVPMAGGTQLRMGVAHYDRHHPQTIQQLLARAREGLRALQT
jgi:DNA-binding NarL/FixJ family response regulator